MKKFLREMGSGRWLGPGGELKSDFRWALEIQDFSEALSLCRRHQLRGMELVMKFPKAEYDLSLPLKDVVGSEGVSQGESWGAEEQQRGECLER